MCIPPPLNVWVRLSYFNKNVYVRTHEWNDYGLVSVCSWGGGVLSLVGNRS